MVVFSGGCFYKYSHHLRCTKTDKYPRVDQMGGGCTDSRFVVALGLAVLERVGARGHFDKSTPEFLGDQV